VVEQKLADMLARNPLRMDYQQKYEEIVADYNREKSRTTIEETFRRLIEFGQDLAWASEGDEPGFPCLD
jgi:type I restriction enzyme R subunit